MSDDYPVKMKPAEAVLAEQAFQMGDKFLKRPVIASLTATCNFDSDLDLKKIALRLKNASYNPSTINQCAIRFLDPRVTVMLSSNGKASAMGAKTIEDAVQAFLDLEYLLNLLEMNATMKDFKIINTTSHASVPFPIHTDSLVHHHSAFCTQETQIFSSAIYKLVKPKATIHIFANGRLVITGKLNSEEINEVFDVMVPVLYEFSENRMNEEASNSVTGAEPPMKFSESDGGLSKNEDANVEYEDEDDDFENFLAEE